MKKFNDKVLDLYFDYPLLIDGIIAGLVWFFVLRFNLQDITRFEKSTQLGLISNLISASVSLAGFILAALTIIVTFKSNLKSKGILDSDNALELIFSSKQYDKIVRAFKKSIIELVLCSIILFAFWLEFDNLCVRFVAAINACGFLILSITTLRSLYVLFIVLQLEKHKKE